MPILGADPASGGYFLMAIGGEFLVAIYKDTSISEEKISEYLLMLRERQSPSYSYFKHTVYGLRCISIDRS